MIYQKLITNITKISSCRNRNKEKRISLNRNRNKYKRNNINRRSNLSNHKQKY